MSFTEYLIGKKTQIIWADETSYGSGADLAAEGVPPGLNVRIEPDFNHNWQEILTAAANERTVEDFELGPLDLPFVLEFVVVDWKFLKYLGYSFTDSGAGPYTHTGSLQDAVQSFKLEWAMIKKNGDPVVITLNGCFGKTGTINFAKGTGEGGESLITIRMNCHAKSVSIGSSYTEVSKITRSPYKFYNAKVTLNNVETVEVNNGEITIDQGYDTSESRYCNATTDRELHEPIPQTHRVTGRYNINIDDDTELQLWNGAAKINDCKLEFIQDAASNYLELAFNTFIIKQGIPSTNFGETYAPDIPWQADKFSTIEAVDSLSNY